MYDYTTALDPAVRHEVLAALANIEVTHQVKIFLACESGSRAWGFPSTDSDYDVRFLYAHPPGWYLSIDVERKRDVIELPISDQLDISGWDLRKALQLFRKSNPPLLEWLQSPLIYKETALVAAQFRALIPTHYQPVACLYHYLHMARGNVRDYLRTEEVWVKKYFYVLRPLLAIQWLEAGIGPVPMAFEVMVNRLIDDPVLKAAIAQLLHDKRAGAELDRGPRIEPISAFIEAEMDRLATLDITPAPKPGTLEELNVFFRSALTTLWE